MLLSNDIKKALKKEDACLVSKKGSPEYVVMKWSAFEKMGQELKSLREYIKDRVVDRKIRTANMELDVTTDESIDINNIPV